MPTIILQITLLVSANKGQLYRKISFFKMLSMINKKALPLMISEIILRQHLKAGLYGVNAI